jgi:hypothetical protein
MPQGLSDVSECDEDEEETVECFRGGLFSKQI